MIFTTVKKKVEVQEKYPDIPVITLLGKTSEEAKAKVAFHLNSKAMEVMGFPMNTPNVSKLANGFDENNKLVLAAMDTNDMYTSNITAKNTFNSQKLQERLVSSFGEGVNEFILNGFEADGIKYAYILPLENNTTEMHDIEDCETPIMVDEPEEQQEVVIHAAVVIPESAMDLEEEIEDTTVVNTPVNKPNVALW